MEGATRGQDLRHSFPPLRLSPRETSDPGEHIRLIEFLVLRRREKYARTSIGGRDGGGGSLAGRWRVAENWTARQVPWSSPRLSLSSLWGVAATVVVIVVVVMVMVVVIVLVYFHLTSQLLNINKTLKWASKTITISTPESFVPRIKTN